MTELSQHNKVILMFIIQLLGVELSFTIYTSWFGA